MKPIALNAMHDEIPRTILERWMREAAEIWVKMAAHKPAEKLSEAVRSLPEREKSQTFQSAYDLFIYAYCHGRMQALREAWAVAALGPGEN